MHDLRFARWLFFDVVCLLLVLSPVAHGDNEKSLVIGIDGLGYGSRGLDVAPTPNIDSLFDGTWSEGYSSAYSNQAFAGGVVGTATQQPTVSGPGWSSMLTGVWADQHNVTNNSFNSPNYSNNPTYLETLEENVTDIHTVSIVNWDPIDTFIIGSVDDNDSSMDFRGTQGSDAGVTNSAVRQIEILDTNVPAAVFVAFDEVDGAGHSCGSSGACYQTEIQQADSLVGRLLTTIADRPNFADENWQIVLTADHGHRASGGHGGHSDLERRIPFIVSSKNLNPGELTAGDGFGVSQADVAPTVLEFFNVENPNPCLAESRSTGVVPQTPQLPMVRLFFEDFESVQLGPNVEEDIGNPMDHVWTKTPPPGWSIEDDVPGQDEGPSNNGVTEWIGWSFAEKDWWVEVAGDQQRSQFTRGQGTVAIADPDEWDDQPHPDSATEGWYNTFLDSPEISLAGVESDSVTLVFDSSWRDEFDSNYHQTANIRVSFDGSDPIEIMRWESDPNSPNFKDDATNESVRLEIEAPEDASSMVLTFGLFDAGNDWWWAVDNIEVLARFFGDFNGDGVVDAVDIDLLTDAMTSGDALFDLNGDMIVDFADRSVLIVDVLNTWFGDSNLDGEFNTSDLIEVFQAAKYESNEAASWSEGDWSGDGFFDTSDLILAFQSGGYEAGPRVAVTVPEPSSAVLIVAGLVVAFGFRVRVSSII